MSLIIQISKGIIRDPVVRRKVMGGCISIACLMMLAGGTFLWRSLSEERWAFIVFWAVCLWMTALSVLLAIFDLLMVRMAARLERRRLKQEVLAAEKLRDGV